MLPDPVIEMAHSASLSVWHQVVAEELDVLVVNMHPQIHVSSQLYHTHARITVQSPTHISKARTRTPLRFHTGTCIRIATEFWCTR